MVFNGLVPQFLRSILLNSTATVSFRNMLRNGNFNVNQRGVSGTVTLAAGVYGHDGWKAGSSGCTYTFGVNSNGDTVLTITAGTLLQIIEGKRYVKNTTGILSWVGTAQAKAYQSSPTGNFASSPVAVTGLAVNTNTIIEFSTGTISCTQFEPGNSVTPFEYRDDDGARCEWYLRVYTTAAAGGIKLSAYTASGGSATFPFAFPTMAKVPTFSLIGTWTYTGSSALTAPMITSNLAILTISGTGLGQATATNPANGGFLLTAEL